MSSICLCFLKYIQLSNSMQCGYPWLENSEHKKNRPPHCKACGTWGYHTTSRCVPYFRRSCTGGHRCINQRGVYVCYGRWIIDWLIRKWKKVSLKTLPYRKNCIIIVLSTKNPVDNKGGVSMSNVVIIIILIVICYFGLKSTIKEPDRGVVEAAEMMWKKSKRPIPISPIIHTSGLFW